MNKIKSPLLVLVVFGAIFLLLTGTNNSLQSLLTHNVKATGSLDNHNVKPTGSEDNQVGQGKTHEIIDAGSSVDTGYTENKENNVDNNINKSNKHNRTVWNTIPPGTQMGTLQIAAIKKALPPDGNLLVWGLGNDSPYWHDITQGTVIFIEHVGVWLKQITTKYPYLEAYTVNYTTTVKNTFDKYINNNNIWSDLDLRSQLPTKVTQTPWHVIIVDAPPGYASGQPGRYQSIYTSSLLAQNGTHIFVDDFDRKIEREFSLKMLGTPVEVIKRDRKKGALASEQAHYIYHTT